MDNPNNWSEVREWVEVAALLAIAGISFFWGWHFSRAKNAQLASKDEQIKSKDGVIEVLKQNIAMLESMTPVQIREYFEANTKSLQEIITQLQSNLDVSKTAATELDERYQAAKNDSQYHADKIADLEKEREIMSKKMAQLKKETGLYKEQLIASESSVMAVTSYADLDELRRRNYAAHLYPHSDPLPSHVLFANPLTSLHVYGPREPLPPSAFGPTDVSSETPPSTDTERADVEDLDTPPKK